MYSNKTTTRLDISLEGCLLFSIQNIASSVQENYCMIFFKIIVVEDRRIFCCIEKKPFSTPSF